MTPLLRPAAGADLAAVMAADGRAFGEHHAAADIERFRPEFERGRFLLACDPADGTVIGVTGHLPFDLTLPGGRPVAAAGVTFVSVAPTHRRRGIMRQLFDTQHRELVAAGTPVALLTASEGGIYGRFGYGAGTWHRSVRIRGQRATFRAGAPDPGGVRFAEPGRMRELAPAIHQRWAAITPAALSRSDPWWDRRLATPQPERGAAGPRFHLLHADGFATFERDHGEDGDTLHVVELIAVTPHAHAALWRVLLSMDLVDTVHAVLAPDDLLPDLLTDPRQVRTTDLTDGMWARVLDVPAALAARRYAVELDVVLEVHDPFLDRGGRFRLRGGPDGAECVALSAAAAGTVCVELGMAELGTLLLGGRRAGPLARAGLIQVTEPGLLRRFDLAWVAERSPQHGTEF